MAHNHNRKVAQNDNYNDGYWPQSDESIPRRSPQPPQSDTATVYYPPLHQDSASNGDFDDIAMSEKEETFEEYVKRTNKEWAEIFDLLDKLKEQPLVPINGYNKKQFMERNEEERAMEEEEDEAVIGPYAQLYHEMKQKDEAIVDLIDLA